MAVQSNAKAEWKGSLKEGGGDVEFGTFAAPTPSPRASRPGKGTNPEELIAAAHAELLLDAAFRAAHRRRSPADQHPHAATVTIEAAASASPSIALETEARGARHRRQADFQEAATKAKEICPVSKALAAVKNMT